MRLYKILIVSLLVLVVSCFFAYHPVFNRLDGLLLLLFPLCFVAALLLVEDLQSDAIVFTPKNILLFIWLNKLVVIPIEILFVGNRLTLFEAHPQPIVHESLLTLISFGCFVLGWCQFKGQFIAVEQKISWPIWLAAGGISMALGLAGIIFLYGSPVNFINNAIYTHKTYDIMRQVAGGVGGYLANVGQRFLPFAVLIGWGLVAKLSLNKYVIGIAASLICIICSLSSNRANMIYPLLALLSAVLALWRFRQLWLLAVLFSFSIILFFFWGYLRVQPLLNSQEIVTQFGQFINNDEYLWQAHQLYMGSPYQLSPIIHLDYATYGATLKASIIDPIPILGKAFREQSGTFLYNLVIFDNPNVQDKVVPVVGELYYNGGYGLVAVIHLMLGAAFVRIDAYFKQMVAIEPIVGAAIFYLFLLSTALLMLSITVFMQFLVFNAAPALFILVVYRIFRK
jgi:hypothetical protein